jgi:hypothetical protein
MFISHKITGSNFLLSKQEGLYRKSPISNGFSFLVMIVRIIFRRNHYTTVIWRVTYLVICPYCIIFPFKNTRKKPFSEAKKEEEVFKMEMTTTSPYSI